MKVQAAVIGAGPAGLMAAETLAARGVAVTIYDAKPSFGRKFLMAGKSGLNLTMDTSIEGLLSAVDAPALTPILRAFDAQAVKAWAEDLGQPLFTGSSGRVFPVAMKASPLLRAWLGRLDTHGVVRQTRARWLGFEGAGQALATPDGRITITPDVTVFAIGGASWARLGSDGAWAEAFRTAGLDLTPFAPSNAALAVDWSDQMTPHLGAAIKAVRWQAGGAQSRGEAVLSAHGLEGGGIYNLTPAVRAGEAVTLDLLPDVDLGVVARKLSRPRGKASLSNHLRKALRLDPVKRALLQEWGRPLPQEADALTSLIKALPVRHAGLRPLDEAISTVGGVPFSALDADLMLRTHPGVYCAGEMLDWDAPTGGYLITACLATGRWAGEAAARRLGM